MQFRLTFSRDYYYYYYVHTCMQCIVKTTEHRAHHNVYFKLYFILYIPDNDCIFNIIEYTYREVTRIICAIEQVNIFKKKLSFAALHRISSTIAFSWYVYFIMLRLLLLFHAWIDSMYALPCMQLDALVHCVCVS